MKLLFEAADRFFKALSLKDYVQVLIIVTLAFAYFSRSDKKDAERAMVIANEISRQDRIRSDSLHRVEMQEQKDYYQRKLDERTDEYIASLREIKDNVKGATQNIKDKGVEQINLNAEVSRKVNRNGKALEEIVNKEPQK